MNVCVRIQLRHVFITTYHLRLQGKSPEFSPDSNYWRLQIFTKKCLIIVNMTNFGFRWVAAMGLEWDLICGYKMIDWMGKVTAWKFSDTILKCGSLWFGHSINHKEKPVGRTSLKRALMNRILLLVGFELLEEVRVKAYPCVEIQGWRGGEEGHGNAIFFSGQSHRGGEWNFRSCANSKKQNTKRKGQCRNVGFCSIGVQGKAKEKECRAAVVWE